MKISYRTHPILKCIESGNLNDNFKYAETADAKMMTKHSEVINAWIEYHEDFLTEKYFFAKSFIDTFSNNIQKLNQVLSEMENPRFSGTYIQNKSVHCFASRGNEDYVYFIFHGNELHFFVRKSNYHIAPFVSKWVSSFAPNNNLYKICYDVVNLMITLRQILTIMPIDTKIINKHSKTKVNNEKFVNDLGFDVMIIDSTWFTNIIHNKEFSVRGHFRLQPVGIGREQRKLIWINDFKKNGYIRKAKKLKYE